jgi:hypothetical protein
MALKLVINPDDKDKQGLVSSIGIGAISAFPLHFNGDTSIDLHVRCVLEDASLIEKYAEDYVSGDSYAITIGNPDDKPARGTFTLTIGATTTSATQFDDTASNIGGGLSTASTTEGKGNVTCTELSPQVWQFDWQTAVAVSAMTCDVTYLNPQCVATVTVIRAGSGSSRAQQIVEIKRDKVASATLSTAYVPTDVAVSEVQVQDTITNAAYLIDWNDAYGGTSLFTVTAGGSVASISIGPTMTLAEIGTAMASHPEIDYLTTGETDNISVTQDGANIRVEFVGTLSSAEIDVAITSNTAANPTVITSGTHGLTSGEYIKIPANNGSNATILGTHVVTVISPTTFSIPVNCTTLGGTGGSFVMLNKIVLASDTLAIYPLGNTGTISFTDTALKKEFFETEDDSLDFEFRLRRTRGADVRTILSAPVQIKR